MGEAPLFILAGAIMVGVLVIVHEAGHYVVARLFKVGTPVFSIGMGPRIFGFRFWETDFRISLLPIGGYVRMAGADAFGEEDAEHEGPADESFMAKPVWQRFLIMLAGPAANIVLPFVLFTAVLMLGRPHLDRTVGRVEDGSTAEQIGLAEGDEIVKVADKDVDNWTEFARAFDAREGAATPIVVHRGEQTRTLEVPEGTTRSTLGIQHHRLSSRVGVSDPTSPAWRAGLRPGHIITKVGDTEVRSFRELNLALASGTEHELTVEHEVLIDPDDPKSKKKRVPLDEPLTITANPAWQPQPEEVLADAWGIMPIEVYVGYVEEDSAAEAAGVKPGDRLLAIDGTRIAAWDDVVGLVGATVADLDLERAQARSGGCFGEAETTYGRELRLDVVRNGEPMTLKFRPQVKRLLIAPDQVTWRPIMGVSPFSLSLAEGERMRKYYGVTEAVPLAADEGVTAMRRIFSVLGNLLRGRQRVQESLGGPIEIVRTAGYAAKQGLFTYVGVMGMISFSLGIINLLPVPVLDGGQILFYAIEGIRGRPLPLALRERVQMVGVLFLAGLMVVVLVNDIGRWLQG